LSVVITLAQLPEKIRNHLPNGYQTKSGCWLVLPEASETRDGIITLNAWLREQDWYPVGLSDIIWFGDDGVGNLLGWKSEQEKVILWNPEDGDSPWKEGDLEEIWCYVLNDYKK
jgi:hypothetical protein